MDKKNIAESLRRKLSVYGRDIKPIEEKVLNVDKIYLDDLIWACDQFLKKCNRYLYRRRGLKKTYDAACEIIENIPYSKKDIEYFCYNGLSEFKSHNYFEESGLFISALMNNPRINEKDFSFIFIEANKSITHLGAFSKNTSIELKGNSQNLNSVGFKARGLRVFSERSIGDYLGDFSINSEYYINGNAGRSLGFFSKKCFFWVGENVGDCMIQRSKNTIIVDGNINSLYGEGKYNIYVG